MSLGLQTIVDKVSDKITGPIAKATLQVLDEKGKSLESIQCGFNPTEYSITKDIKYRCTFDYGKDFNTKKMKTGGAMPSTLSVKIFVDEKTNMKSSILKYGGAIYNATQGHGFKVGTEPSTVKQVCEFLESFVHYDSKKLTIPLLAFIWGDMRFVGRVQNVNVQFIMFDKSGNPTRAKIGLRIVGDEDYFLKKRDSISTGAPAVPTSITNAINSGALNPRV